MNPRQILFLALAIAPYALADGPGDNLPDKVRKVPPPGIKLTAEQQDELAAGLKKLDALIAVLSRTDSKSLLPDVEVCAKAVRYALKYDEFFNVKEIAVAKDLVKVGMERAEAALAGKHPWTTETGLVVRGYRSKIDGSVQPYGLVIPKDYDFKKKIRLDFWCHGRGETLSELNFIQSCRTSPGQFASDKAIVLNLYGRFCCANKLAGEIDCFEALEHAKKNYAIDEDRLVMRGFSMGGAACWQFAVHYPSMWCAAAPGAGFSETPEFLKVFQNEDVSQAPWWEKKLWHMYDCTDYALNLFNLPTVAYSGEIDKQKQAADIMEKALKAEGLDLIHIIGPKTGHSYEKGAKAEIIERIDRIAEKGRDPFPKEIQFVTYTLRYNRCAWLEVVGLEKHWERGKVIATRDGGKFDLKTKGVQSVRLHLPPNLDYTITVDGKTLIEGFPSGPRGSRWTANRVDGKWTNMEQSPEIAKRHGLQGPIDDAFLDTFLMVKPTGTPQSMKTGMWVDREMQHAITHWRQQFRGDAPVKDDKQVTDDDIANANLILWGDPSSNAILKKIADKLPIKWKDHDVIVGADSFPGSTHMPLLIYPNPLNPRKYVVLNSGFTYREYDYLNNARQVPKLPDYAVVDVSVAPTSRAPGRVVTAGFFGEKWELPAKR